MKKSVLFLILILPIGCAVTSTKQLEQTSQRGEIPAASQQLSKQSETGEDKTSSKIEVQRMVEGMTVYSHSEDRVSSGTEVQKPLPGGEEGLKLAKPVPETLRQPRQPWGGIWRAPLNQQPPFAGEEKQSQNIETPPPASWKDYEDVVFGKFASGSYVSDYANKYVKIKCRFVGIATEFVEIPKYSRPEYITFTVTGVNSQLHTIRLVVPRHLADAVFKLRPREEIVLYGKAVQVDSHTLTLEVGKIER